LSEQIFSNNLVLHSIEDFVLVGIMALVFSVAVYCLMKKQTVGLW